MRGRVELVGTALLLVAGCGARTLLDQGTPDAGPGPPDAGFDAGFDAGLDAGLDAGFDAGPPDGGHCVPGRTVLPAGQVQVVFVIDSSTSMGWVPSSSTDGLTRWEILRIAMHEAFAGLDPRAQSGALFFPSLTRCAVSLELHVPIAPDNIDLVVSAFDGQELMGRSPIARACTYAGLALREAVPTGRNRFLVLITDGDTTCMGVSPRPTVRALRSRFGIETFVVGMGSGVAGIEGGGRGHYLAHDLESLRGMLGEIADALGGCVFDVPLARTPDAEVIVRVGGAEVSQNRVSGWDWSGSAGDSISLFGAACRARIRENAAVELTFACEP